MKKNKKMDVISSWHVSYPHVCSGDHEIKQALIVYTLIAYLYYEDEARRMRPKYYGAMPYLSPRQLLKLFISSPWNGDAHDIKLNKSIYAKVKMVAKGRCNTFLLGYDEVVQALGYADSEVYNLLKSDDGVPLTLLLVAPTPDINMLRTEAVLNTFQSDNYRICYYVSTMDSD